MPGCLVKGCTSGYKSNLEKVHWFTVPKDDELRKKWQIALKRSKILVAKAQMVCEKHFLSGDIIRTRQFLSPEGRVLGVSPYQRPRLAIGAVPSLFPWTEVIPSNNGDENILEHIRETLEKSESSEICLATKRLKKQQEEAQGVSHDIQEQETSGPSFNIKEEITIDESVLEDYLIPKSETFENASADTTNDVDPLSLSYMGIQTSQETVSRCTPETTTVVSPNIGDKSHNKTENANFTNIIPKLETFDNTSEDILTVEENGSFPRVQNQPVQETRILRSTLKDNTKFSPSSLNTSQTKKRKCGNQDSRVEDHDFLNIVQVKSENCEDYADYAMYVAARLKNCNQSANAIAIAKEKIELILCDLDKGVFENLIGVLFSCNI